LLGKAQRRVLWRRMLERCSRAEGAGCDRVCGGTARRAVVIGLGVFGVGFGAGQGGLVE